MCGRDGFDKPEACIIQIASPVLLNFCINNLQIFWVLLATLPPPPLLEISQSHMGHVVGGGGGRNKICFSLNLIMSFHFFSMCFMINIIGFYLLLLTGKLRCRDG